MTTRTHRPIGATGSGRKLQWLALIGAILLLMTTAVPAQAAPTPDRLAHAGWFCEELPEVTHCIRNVEQLANGEAATGQVLAWGADGTFWGTELLLHEDLYNGQPCPQDDTEGTDGWLHLSELGDPLPYYVCHHFDSPFT